ncbi:MAG: hypothetical protein Q7S18_00325 [bacterium]|nr:hypothetical protein [bacterium]
MKKIINLLFIIVLIVLGVSYFIRKDYKSVKDINPNVIIGPIQTDLEDKKPINFVKDGYSYSLTPKFNYEFNGLVVHTMNYDVWYSLSRSDKVFPLDICAVWGNSVSNKAYSDKSLRFSQDMRFCYIEWGSGIRIQLDEFSNNHLLTNDDKIKEKFKSIFPGDQIKIKGKLADVKAQLVGAGKKYESNGFTMATSTVRSDTDAGACEIIYVEDVEILKKGHLLAQQIFEISYYTLIGIIIFRIIYFFFRVFYPRKYDY